jgi:hypothetical protein
MNDNSPLDPGRVRAERDLGQFSVTIEVTLISVMVGVIIFPLMDFATPLLRDLKFEYWPYILAGTVIVINVWTEVIVHTLSIVSWPLDIVRNALYIGTAVIIAILMHFLADPRSWFTLSVLTALMIVLITWYDLRVIGRKQRSAVSIPARALFATLLKRQRRSLVQGALYLAFNLVATAFAFGMPEFFIDQRGHLLFIAVQLTGGVFTLARTINDFSAWSEPILRVAMQDLDLPLSQR